MVEFKIAPQPLWSKSLDWLCAPVMCVLQGNWWESPQRTHLWNNQKLTRQETESLERGLMVEKVDDYDRSPRWWRFVPLMHMPILGGWRKYVTLQPASSVGAWYVGWIAGDVMGVSQVSIQGPVRLLRGNLDTQWFAIDAATGRQIKLVRTGEGTIGQASIGDQMLPLL